MGALEKVGRTPFLFSAYFYFGGRGRGEGRSASSVNFRGKGRKAESFPSILFRGGKRGGKRGFSREIGLSSILFPGGEGGNSLKNLSFLGVPFPPDIWGGESTSFLLSFLLRATGEGVYSSFLGSEKGKGGKRKTVSTLFLHVVS